MQYLTQPDEIHEAIIKCASARILWLDTEIADYKSGKPRLSLIQVLDDATDTQADCPPVTDKDDRILILDLLDRSELIYEFIDKIMLDPTIEKVFHNASYDRQLLGKSKAKNVTCTWEIAKKIPYYILPVPNYQLKTLAQQLCHFSNIDKTQQISDWGQRPLTAKQLEYAKMDVVYVAQVHHQLLQLSQRLEIDPDNEDLTALTLRYRQIEHRWKVLDTEFKHLKERLKQAMASQNVPELDGFKLSIQERKHKKIAFDELAKFTQEYGVNLDFPIRLTQEIQKEMTNIIEKIPIEEEVEKVFMLKVSEVEDDDLPF